MPQFTALAKDIYICAQLRESDLPEVARAGFKTVICHRPDHEEDGQPDFADIAGKLHTLGIARTHHQPVTMPAVGVQDAQTLAETLAAESGHTPVLMFCRTGTRSAVLWNMIQAASGADIDTLIRNAAENGIDLSPARAKLESAAEK